MIEEERFVFVMMFMNVIGDDQIALKFARAIVEWASPICWFRDSHVESEETGNLS
jgi:hypothetical protein